MKRKILLSSILICFLFSACSSKEDTATNKNLNQVITEQENQEDVKELVNEPTTTENTEEVGDKQANSQETSALIFNLDDYDESLTQKADGWTNGSMFDCTWRGDNVTFLDGVMTLKIDKDGENSSPKWSGGEYRTKDFYHYGKYEVSMKPIKNDGVVSSFFTYTGPSDNNPWDEIDIEFLGKDTTKVQFNYFTNGIGSHEYVYDLGFDASEDLHVYGFEWLTDSITWYVDGVAVYTATKDIPSTPSKIMMNVWPGTGVDSWLNAFNGQVPLQAKYEWFQYTKQE